MAITRSVNRARIIKSTPREVWIKIWSHLDFETLQKTCTLVSKTWFEEIRNSANLSGEMTLKISWRSDMEDMNKILSHWKKLKMLCVGSSYKKIGSVFKRFEASGQAIQETHTACTEFGFGIDLTSHNLLRKIIISKFVNLTDFVGNWAITTHVWFDPKGGLISESFSLLVHLQKKCAKSLS